MFELKHIIAKAVQLRSTPVKCVLATVVDLDGSSYRKPGVRMLIAENGETVGAVSGGCVEKEVVRQAEIVLESGVPKVMTYDGRYRLGCEGIIYILIEPLVLSDDFIDQWSSCLKSRTSIRIESAYEKGDHTSAGFGSCFYFENLSTYIRSDFTMDSSTSLFKQTLRPTGRLVIVGAEHDAVQMCLLAGHMGLEVTVVTSIKDPRSKSNFCGARVVKGLEPDQIGQIGFDEETAVILMTHSYSRDFQYALSILKEPYAYFGIIGSTKRRNMLMDELLQYDAEIDWDKLENIFTPAGLDIGAVTPQEIAISVLAEIVAKTRDKYTNRLEQAAGNLKNGN